MSRAELDARWALIEKTRPHDANTGEAEPGSFGRAFLLWHNNSVDRVMVMRRVGLDNVKVQRFIGGQHMDIPLMSLRTEGEILAHLRDQHPRHVPKSLKNWWPGLLPVAIIREIWGK